MVGGGCTEASVAIAIGSPATLLTTTVATAPASCVDFTLAEKTQVPRETTAILPVRLPAGSAAHAVLRPFVVPETAASGAVRSDWTTAKSPVAAPYVVAPTRRAAPTKWPTVLAPAVSARCAEPGDSTV